MNPVYIYRARVDRIIDGDTFVFDVDLGFRVTSSITVRLRGLYAAERNEPGGPAATAHALSVLMAAKSITLSTYKDHKSFDRWIADVWVDGRLLADVLHGANGQ